ncbi:group 1 truncated hemoglobin [Pseudonocardia sp. RS11V-5]|uniref:group I truncated hemoglobin n=1 Tax=Pseudonocardia terrae TaxID=2905831 RepID=UPI001E4D6652|nr:group 1 truncated hemoglobin [Pseudonocardia terrae]MCE3555009.1 group 1 truncated hemoglobin [Pseudonocardia terrae]
MTSSKRATIYDEIGGADAVAAAVDRFYVRVLGDPALVGYFDGIDMKRLKAHQRSFVAAAIGGPELYSGRPMKEAHARFRIQPDHFDLVVGHLVATLTELGVPAETIGQIGEKLAPLKSEIAPPENAPAAAPARRRWFGRKAG